MWKVAGGFVDSAVAEIRAEAASGLLSPQHHAGHLEFPADGQLSPMGLGVDAMDVWHDNASPVGGGDDSGHPSLMGQHPPAELPPLGGHGAPAYGASPIGHGHGHGFDHRRPLDSSDWGSAIGSRGQAAGGHAAASTGSSGRALSRAPKRQASEMDGSDSHSMELHMPLTHHGAAQDRIGSSGSDPAGRHSNHGSSHMSAVLAPTSMARPPVHREAPHGFGPSEPSAGTSTLSDRVLGRPRALASSAVPPALPSRQQAFTHQELQPSGRTQQALQYQHQHAQQYHHQHHLHHAPHGAQVPAAWAAQASGADALSAPRKPASHPSHGEPSPHSAPPVNAAKRLRTDCVDVAALIAGRGSGAGLLAASATGSAAPALVAAAQSLAKHGAANSVSGAKADTRHSRRAEDEDDEDEEEEEDLTGATPARRNEAKERRRQRKNDRERRRRQEVSGAMDDLADVVQTLTGTARRNKSDKVTVLLGALRAIHGLTEGLRAVTSLVQSASHGPSKHQTAPPVVTEETAGIMASALGTAHGRR